MTRPQTLGVLGFGDAARTITASLQEVSPREILVWKRHPWSDDVRASAQGASVTLCAEASDVAKRADVLFSLVTPTAAAEVADRVGGSVAGKFYVDLNAASMRAIERTAEVVTANGGRFVDGAIMGPLKRQRHAVSTLVSGDEAEALAEMLRGWQMNVRAIGTKPGLASTVKMIRSVYTKGLEAAVVEFMIAAKRCDATEAVLDSLEEIIELGPFLLPLREMVRELILEQVPHAARRGDEMEQVTLTMQQLGVDPLTAGSAFKRLRWITEERRLKERFAGEEPTYDAVLDALAE